MTRRLAIDEEIEAVRALCVSLGLGDAVPALLKAAHHTTLIVEPFAMVARVQSAEPMTLAIRRAEREIAVTRHLDEQGAPAVRPFGDLAGPHVSKSAVVTFWHHIAHDRGAEACDAKNAATSLAVVHRALHGHDGELPPYTAALDRCFATLMDPHMSVELAKQDRALLGAQFRRLRSMVEASARQAVPLHGDVHLGNLLVGGGGPVWIDFEDACRGPAEYDVAGLPPEMWSSFPDADLELLRTFADLRSVCVAIWCWADPDRGPEIREAADYHLDRVRAFAR